MAITATPLPPGTRIRLTVELEVVEDRGATLEVLIPNGDGTRVPRLLDRAAVESGEVVNG